MNKAVVTALAILVILGAVVEKGESYIRAGREMVYNRNGDPTPLLDEYYYDKVQARRSAKRG